MAAITKKQTNPICLIMYDGNDWTGSMTFADTDQRHSYERLYVAMREAGIEPVRASIDWFNGKVFTKCWTFDGSAWKKVQKSIAPTIVLDKPAPNYAAVDTKILINEQYIVLNPWELEMVASDKLLTNAMFVHHVPETLIVRNTQDLAQATASLNTKEYIYKPRLGHGGKGIQFFTKNTLQNVELDSLGIVQRVIDTTKGIPGVYKGMHDLRVVIAGERIVAAFIRNPAPGTKLCNISQGGTAIQISIRQLPKSLRGMVKDIQKNLQIFPHKLYSLDFFFENGRKPLLIEMNTKPIIAFPEQYRQLEGHMQKALITYVASVLKSHI